MQSIMPPHERTIREDAATGFGPASEAPDISPVFRWLVRTDEGTLRHTHETPRAVRRRLGLSARQYRCQRKAAKRAGPAAIARFLRQAVAEPC